MWTQDSFKQSPAGVPISASITNGGKGWFGMGQAGCDYEFSLPLFSFWRPHIIVGAFGDYDFSSLTGTNSNPDFVGSEKNSASWFAGARVGYVVTPRVLTYFDGGWTQARFDQVNFNFLSTGGPAPVGPAAQTYSGWFVGSGLEYSLDILPIPGLFLKTEYRYSQYSSANVPILFTATGAQTGFTVNSSKAIQMVSTELVWRFNWFGR